MKKAHLQRLRLIILLVLGCILFVYILCSVYNKYKIVQSLKAVGIYEISFTYVQVEKRTEIHYMVCEAPSDTKSIQKQIDSFLDKEQVIEAARVRSVDLVEELGGADGEKQPLAGINLVFLSPSKDLGIGEFPDDIYDSKYHIGGHRLLTVAISFSDSGNYEMEYLWPRNTN